MNKSLTGKLSTLAGITALSTSATAQPTLYDDFSSGTLDASKWLETTIPSAIHGDYPLFDEHFVNASGMYQVGQYSPGNRSLRLVPTRQFLAGETLDYDIFHVLGEGNHLSHLYTDDSLPNYQNQPNFSAGPGIGYWNDIPDTGNQLGRYHAHLVFNSNSIDLDFTRPDGTHYTNTITSSDSPHNISFGNYTGHDGTTRFDFDNFWINGIPSPSTLALLGLGLATTTRKRR